jgi:hypothetical protein
MCSLRGSNSVSCSCDLDMYESNSPVIGINGGTKLAHFSLFFVNYLYVFLRKP